MTSPKRWSITGDKFLTLDQVKILTAYLLERRDLAIARQNSTQAIKDYYMFRTLLETGVRVFEFCNLTLADFQGQKLYVRHGKGDKARTILLTKTSANMIKEWLSVRVRLGFIDNALAPLFPSRYAKPYTTRGVQKRVKLIFEAVTLPHSLSVHSLRHTYCSLLLASGKASIATVKENLGHHSIAVTNLYSHAIGDLGDVELYPDSSSQKTELSELETKSKTKKLNSSVNTFLRNVNLK